MAKKQVLQLKVLKEWILSVLKKRHIALNIKQISWEVGLKGSQHRKKILRAIDELIDENLIINSEKYKFQYCEPEDTITGTIDLNASQHGYVVSDLSSQHIFIHRKNRLNSLHGDTVSISLVQGKKKQIEGVVDKVLSRARTKFIGEIKIDNKNAFFIPNNKKIGSDFFIPQKKLNYAKNNDQVIIEFTDWPVEAGCPFGRVVKVLDKKLNLKNQIESSIEIFNIRSSFSQKIREEVEKLPTTINSQEIKMRKDFRKEITFTIDPDDAKDFDDAISVKFLHNKNIEIGVHIADVGHYVKSKSAIDEEAFLRAFSVYFPGKVIPMLPEKLSNILCSLRPNEDKLSFSILIKMNDSCQIESTWIGKGIINSNKRFSYKEVEQIILNKKGEFYNELSTLNLIAKKLKLNRIEGGSINFERTDIDFILDEQGEPASVCTKKSLNAHKLVEEFMLLSNKIVAEKLTKINQSIYRIHDLPDMEKIRELISYLEHLERKKIKASVSHKNSTQFINNLLNRKHPAISNNILENLILRSMAKAKYSTKNIGHYGLGFKKYTHFTSPIRRYADLIIHRLLYESIKKQRPSLMNLEKKCIHFSNVERTHIDIARKTNKFIQLKLLENSIGNVFHGSISGVVKWGIYVEIDDNKGEGLVSSDSLSDDKYYHNSTLYAFIGRKSGKKYNLGDRVLVEIKSINLLRGEMDLVFAS